MKITDRRILLLPALIALGAWISSSVHSYVPVLVAAEIGLIGMFFMRTPEQKKIVSSRVLAVMMGLLLVGIALVIYLHR